MNDIIELLNKKINDEKRQRRINKNNNIKNISALLELFSDIDNLSKLTHIEFLDNEGKLLANFLSKEEYKTYVPDIIDLINHYKLINSNPIELNDYKEILNILCGILKNQKLELEKTNNDDLVVENTKYYIDIK